MFGIGMPELFLILAVALIVIGPKKLPDLAKSLGRAMGEFKKATHELKQSIDINSDLKDVKDEFEKTTHELKQSIDINSDLKDVKDKFEDMNDSIGEAVDDVSTPSNDKKKVDNEAAEGPLKND